jgi:cytochrome c556
MVAILGLPSAALPQSHDHGMHQHQADSMPGDARQTVRFPEPLRTHILANMRDHLTALGQIQEALSRADFDTAADIVEQRLGMSSLASHGAHEVAPYMPQGMQDAGSAMHRSASRFALAAKDASVTGDWKAALGALAQLNQSCVACHAGYRLE